MIESLVTRIRAGRYPDAEAAESFSEATPVPRRSPLMKALEFLGGVVLGSVSLLVLLLGSLVAFGSIGRYLKAKNM